MSIRSPQPDAPASRAFSFGVAARGSTPGREALGGLSTFLALSYILFVQPGLLAMTGMDRDAVFYGTCLAAAFATLFMAVSANYPIALAPGMGENFLFVFTLCAAAPVGFGLTWQQGLAATFLAGVAFMLLAGVGLREKLVHAVPASLQAAIAAGIGLFITFIGLQYGNLIVANPGTLVALGSLRHPVTLVALFGLAVAIVLFLRRVRGALLIAMLASTALSLALKLVSFHGVVSTDFRVAPVFLQLDFRGLFGRPLHAVLVSIAILFFLALFDTIGTLVALSRQAGLLVNGKVPRAERALFADAAGSAAGACLGSTTITCYIESAAGIADGARTGLASVVTGSLFLVAMLFAPLVAMVGGGVVVGNSGGVPIVRYPAIAPALILVGSMMMRTVREIDWEDPTEFIPAFLTIVGIPLTFSIATGIALGLATYVLAKVVTGHARQVPVLIYVFAVFLALVVFLSH